MNTDTTHATGVEVALPRLYQFDLPRLKQTGQLFPELGAGLASGRVLDLASGRGEWAIAAAQAAPQLEIVGIEGDAELVEQARAQGIEHATFRVMDPFGRLELEEHSFDLVNARYLTGRLPAAAWPAMLRECVRVTRSGGIVRLTETDMPISNSAALETLNGWIARAYSLTKRSFSPSGRVLSVAGMLKPFLQEAGCQQVQQAVWHINFSTGLPAHSEVTTDLAQTYRLLLPFLVSVGLAGQQEVEQTYQQMLADMQAERFTANAISMTVWGIRP